MFALLLFFTGQILVAYGASNKAGAVKLFEITKFEPCKYNNELKSTIELEIQKNGNDKYLKGKLGLPVDFDSTFKLDIKADRWTGSEWKIDYFKQNGLACDMFQKVMPDIFSTITSKFEPAILPTKCNIPKNTYTFDHVEAVAKEVKIPSLMYSKYRLFTRIFTKEDKEILCVLIEMDAKE